MTDIDLAKLKRLAEKATLAAPTPQEDRDYLALLTPRNILALIERVERVERAEIERLRGALVAIEEALCKDSRQKSIVGDEVEYHLDGQTMYYAINKARAALAPEPPPDWDEKGDARRSKQNVASFVKNFDAALEPEGKEVDAPPNAKADRS